ncbi:hypothetical protein THAOC_34148 [Thalassiosira oceanica]|uniref:Uncharacterized protein n=1 Tax=Thalassiosira oceanica TaxID=159749 RepID=K0R5P6_THAOC|nr:hypothetical protein THAOC_34148 [Thalassiosira oceanica]|eukprot:EJK47159.1 hypothetical protein THAOC_34148 [Thalassiosira oceanica]
MLRGQTLLSLARNPATWSCMGDAQKNVTGSIAAIEVRIVSLTHLAKDGSNPAHGKKEQADDHHPELAEKKNLPADNGTQKVSDGTSLIHSECSDLDLTQLKWT